MSREIRLLQLGYEMMLLSDPLSYCGISIGNSMICSDSWHKYHE